MLAIKTWIRNRTRVPEKALRLALARRQGFRVKDALLATASEVQSVLERGSVPLSMLKRIRRELSLEHGLAVRSAAFGEDGECGGISWAGQWRSELHVETSRGMTLEDAILACAKASENETLLAYARANSVAVPSLCLIVQEMVNASVAGILFTDTDDGNHAVIEVVNGVAEELASGTQTPQQYLFNFVYGSLRPGNDVDPSRLNEVEARQVLSLGWDLKRNLFPQAQDIEWAIEAGTGDLYLNQTRNLSDAPSDFGPHLYTTALIAERERVKNDCDVMLPPDILAAGNVVELITENPSQAAFGLFSYMFDGGEAAIHAGRRALGYGLGQEVSEGVLLLVAGSPRFSRLHFALRFRPKGISLSKYLELITRHMEIYRNGESDPSDSILQDCVPDLALLTEVYKEDGECLQHHWEALFSGLDSAAETLATECQGSFLPTWRRRMREFGKSTPVTTRGLVDRYKMLCENLRLEIGVRFVQTARLAYSSYRRLGLMLKMHFESRSEELLHDLTSGFSSQENPNLALVEALADLRDGDVKLATVLSRFGHLAQYQQEISTLRYREQPELLVQLAQQLTGDPRALHREREEETRRTIAVTLDSVSDGREKLEKAIDRARTYLCLREMVKFEFLKAHELIRQTSCELERRWEWSPGLIFNLDPCELFMAHQLPAEYLFALASERAARRERFKHINVPKVIHENPLSAVAPEGVRTLRGLGVTRFVCEGVAFVIRDLADTEALARLEPGMILVTPTADPAVGPLVASIGSSGALVTEIGGQTSHAAVIARSMRVAAVLAVDGATTKLQTGVRVRVNGLTGTVSIID